MFSNPPYSFKSISSLHQNWVEKKNKPKVVVKKRSKVQFHIGDHVRLFDGNAVGTIDSLEKNKAIVNYGTFTTQVDSDELELVKRS